MHFSFGAITMRTLSEAAELRHVSLQPTKKFASPHMQARAKHPHIFSENFNSQTASGPVICLALWSYSVGQSIVTLTFTSCTQPDSLSKIMYLAQTTSEAISEHLNSINFPGEWALAAAYLWTHLSLRLSNQRYLLPLLSWRVKP